MPAVHFIHDPCALFIHSCAGVGSRWGQDGGVKIFAKVDAQTNLCEAGHREISAPWLCGEGDCDYTLLTPSAEREDDSCCQPPACPSLHESHHSRARVCSLCHCCCQSRPWCLAAPPCPTLVTCGIFSASTQTPVCYNIFHSSQHGITLINTKINNHQEQVIMIVITARAFYPFFMN